MSTNKMALRRFTLRAAGGYRGRDGDVKFVRELLDAFGCSWESEADEVADGVVFHHSFPVVDDGKRTTRTVTVYWPERRVVVDVVHREMMLDLAWRDVLRACLQMTSEPQYVVLTNQRDFRLYDLARDRNEPRLTIALDELPKHSEAFPFFGPGWIPGTTPKIVNESKVSKEVAELVAKVYRALLEKNPGRDHDVIRFTLQCIVSMFAEDIGLLPKEYFTTLLYEGAESGDAEKRLGRLFVAMSTKDRPADEIPYFNGGLFIDPISLKLGDRPLRALTKASEADWTFVDPHIFGSVFQGIMTDAERHSSGAHYTAREDIMSVVGPTIIEPWRRRLDDASTLSALQSILKDLAGYRVLDPACGSGNFLYVAFRELYKLETEVLRRLYEFSSVQHGKKKATWISGLRTTNFYGIDSNPFAVELAKATLNIAKKIAFEERKAMVLELYDQAFLDIDPSLPLDNLDKSIVCADALFCEWPEVEAIVGNPPFLTGASISTELGAEYQQAVRAAFPEVHGRADLCAYWFRRAHDRLPRNGRAGLIGTTSVREGHTRAASTEYIVANGGEITNAVSSRAWPGDAVVNVSMVNWIKGAASGPRILVVEGTIYERSAIRPHLQLHADAGDAVALNANGGALSSQGVHIGTKACQTDRATAEAIYEDPAARPYVRAVAQGKHLLASKLSVAPDYIVDMSACHDLKSAERGGAAFRFLKKHKLPAVEAKAASFKGWTATWWRAWRTRDSFFRAAEGMSRIVVCSKHAARPVFVFLSSSFLPTDSLQMFAFDDDYSFGVLQSGFHWSWALAQGSKIKQDTRYTMGVWNTFPWPQSAGEAEIVEVAQASRELRATRDRLIAENGWSLRELHQSADVKGPHPLKEAQRALDDAVARAYQHPAGQEAIEFLLELNLCIAEDEESGHAVVGPGLPPGFDSRDARLYSTDCIEPPPLGAR